MISIEMESEKFKMKKKIIIILSILIILVIAAICIINIGLPSLKTIPTKSIDTIDFDSHSLVQKYVNENENPEIEGIADLTTYGFNLKINNEEKFLKLLISDDEELYIYDLTESKFIIASELPFKSLYVPDIYNENELICYAISNEELYQITLNSTDINDIVIEKLDTEFKVDSFVLLKSDPTNVVKNVGVYVVTTTGEVVDAITGVSIVDTSVNLENEYSILSDGRIIDKNGYYLTDTNNEPFKYKYSFHHDKYDKMEGTPDILIMTTNNKLIYSYNNKLYVSKNDIDKFDDSETDEGYIINRIYFTNDEYYDITGKIYKIEF